PRALRFVLSRAERPCAYASAAERAVLLRNNSRDRRLWRRPRRLLWSRVRSADTSSQCSRCVSIARLPSKTPLPSNHQNAMNPIAPSFIQTQRILLWVVYGKNGQSAPTESL